MNPAAPPPRQLAFRLSLAAVAGLATGLAVAALAVLMTGAGPGWSSALTSASSLLGAPLAFTAWACPPGDRRRLLARFAVCIAVGGDSLLLARSAQEGVGFMTATFENPRVWVVAWAVLFVAWQIIAAALATDTADAADRNA